METNTSLEHQMASRACLIDMCPIISQNGDALMTASLSRRSTKKRLASGSYSYLGLRDAEKVPAS